MDYTTNLKLPLLVPNQAGKEIMHNEALVILDNIVQNGIISKDLSIPPENPNTNDIYIVGANATGTWEGKDNQLAFFDNGWRFIEPREGFTFWINDKDKLYCYNGTNWQEITSSDSSTTSKINELQNLSLCGINATANNENKLSVKSDYVLFDNNGNNSKIKVNKAIETDTASHLFQNNYSGRAEFGLIGDDNFTLKVSSDGENWNNAFVVDKETGNIDFKGEITQNGNNISAFSKIYSITLNNTSYVVFNNLESGYDYIIYFNNIKGSMQNFAIVFQYSTDNGSNFVSDPIYNSVITTNHSTNVHHEAIDENSAFYLTSATDGWSLGGNNQVLFSNGVLKLFNPNISNNSGKIACSDFNYRSSGTAQTEQAHSTNYTSSTSQFNAIKIFLNNGIFTSGIVTIYKQML